MKVLYADLETAAPFVFPAEKKAGLKECDEGFTDGGGRAGSEEGGCGVAEEGSRPGGGGRDMMNGCPEEKGRRDIRRTESLTVSFSLSQPWSQALWL